MIKYYTRVFIIIILLAVTSIAIGADTPNSVVKNEYDREADLEQLAWTTTREVKNSSATTMQHPLCCLPPCCTQ